MDHPTPRGTVNSKKQEDRRAAVWTRKYQLTSEDVVFLLDGQGWECELCGVPLDLSITGSGSFHIDHDHRCCFDTPACGDCIRGLLCANCNVGRFGDNITMIQARLDYMKREGRFEGIPFASERLGRPQSQWSV